MKNGSLWDDLEDAIRFLKRKYDRDEEIEYFEISTKSGNLCLTICYDSECSTFTKIAY